MTYFVGLDLGQQQDYTALAVVQRVQDAAWDERAYHVRHLQRWPLGTPYTTLVDATAALLALPPLAEGCVLVIDATGVGAAVCDLFRETPLAAVERIEVQLTSGHDVTREAARLRVPKKDVVAAVAVLLQAGKLKVAPALSEAVTLMREFREFRIRVTEAGHMQFGAWREGQHDDLVLATALACWYAETEAQSRSGLAYVAGSIIDLCTGEIVRTLADG